MEIKTVAIIGSGSVATNLASALRNVVEIKQIWSRHHENSFILAEKTGLQPEAAIDSLDRLIPDLDLYIISVPDNGYREIYDSFPEVSGIVVNTSGGTPMPSVKSKSGRFGVFYPLQTFRKSKITCFRSIPILIEGTDSETIDSLVRLGNKISDRVKVIEDNEKKAKLHLAAVFASNFPNYLWSLSSILLNECGENLEFLKELITENISNALELGADASQTGPAMRGDTKVIARHLGIISESGLPSPVSEEIYSLLSEAIFKKYHPDNEQDKL